MLETMDNKDYAKIIANNLRRIMYDNGKSQAELSRALGISKATLSSWMNGTRIPRMQNIDMLCHYFNVSRADIMEPQTENKKEYYTSETLQMAQDIFDNPDLRALMKAAKDCDSEQLRTVATLISQFKETNRDG